MKQLLLIIAIIGSLPLSAQNLFFLSLNTGYQETLHQLNQYREITWVDQQPEQQLCLRHHNTEVRYYFDHGKLSSIELHKHYQKKKYFKRALRDSRKFFKAVKLKEEKLIKQKHYRQYRYAHPQKLYRLISSQDKKNAGYLISLSLARQSFSSSLEHNNTITETVFPVEVYH